MDIKNATKFFCWMLMAAAVFSLEAPARVGGARAQGGGVKAAPEMERLQKMYVGTWDYTETYAKTAMSPDGGTGAGVYTSELGPGGNSILNRFHSKGNAGDYDGMLVMTWDPNEKAYKSFVFGNSFPGCVTQTGQFEGDALVYRSELAMAGMKIKLRNVSREVSPGKIVSEQYVTPEGTAEKLLVTVEATKRK